MHQLSMAHLVGLLFLACLGSSRAQSEAGGAGTAGGAGEAGAGTQAAVVHYEVGQAHLELRCPLPGLAPAAAAALHWSKNGTALGGAETEAGDAARWTAGPDGVLRLTGRAHDDDYGNYTCASDAEGAAATVEVVARPIAKLPANTNVVEGQKLKLSCKLLGRPYGRVTWLFAESGAPAEANATEAVGALAAAGVSARLQASEQGAADGELLVEAASRALAGRYTCYAGAGNRNATTTLRVKDMYAALWPFLGIVLEVVVLCSVIAVYERRRTKPDLADSDTDTPSQKKS